MLEGKKYKERKCEIKVCVLLQEQRKEIPLFNLNWYQITKTTETLLTFNRIKFVMMGTTITVKSSQSFNSFSFRVCYWHVFCRSYKNDIDLTIIIHYWLHTHEFSGFQFSWYMYIQDFPKIDYSDIDARTELY